MVGFTVTCANLQPSQVLHVMHDVWFLMDSSISDYRHPHQISSNKELSKDARRLRSSSVSTRDHEVFKVDTVGDAYIVAALVKHPTDEKRAAVAFDVLAIADTIAQSIQHYSANGAHCLEPGGVKIRLGLSLGPVSVGFLGLLQPRYHMYGKAMDQAVRAESQSKPFFLAVEAETMRGFFNLSHEGDKPGLLDLRVDGYDSGTCCPASTCRHAPMLSLDIILDQATGGSPPGNIATRRRSIRPERTAPLEGCTLHDVPKGGLNRRRRVSANGRLRSDQHHEDVDIIATVGDDDLNPAQRIHSY
eukprot:CAMPEP_0118936904 /NCGR_PEP_ID=MMETSP1169-20130426/21022_1 /TAXON_ID=36882 /ORGANISM="Pyramimonas obovata, Strain CCMP722" /LENGTH=302 /DNA_ID=CAMNT_0006880365 /DNA_START=20 /DNA_END=928 /DNA_ORIENTATION=+